MVKNRITASLGSLLVISLILLYSCSSSTDQEALPTASMDNSIRLSNAQIQLANIQVAEARSAGIGHRLLLSGVVKVNEESAVSITSRTAGRILKLFFKNTGETVQKGDSLYTFFGEEMISAEREYLTLQSNNWNFSGKYAPSLILEDKLSILGMLPSQIKQLKQDGKILFSVTLLSPVNGIIRSINATEGQYIKEGDLLFELADDNELWVEAQVYPNELQFLKIGIPATVKIPAAGDIRIKSKISFINPSFEAGKNVTLIRAIINNPQKNLHPGMLALLNVQTGMSRGIAIPISALINDKEGGHVWVQDEDGSFSIRMVTSGIQSADSVLILSGLEGSEKIVVSGAYLLNSEMILNKGTSSIAVESL